MRLAFCSGGLSGRCVPLPRGTTRVGRSHDNDITLPRDDVTVSRAHATIERGEDVLTVRDAGSATGTFVNGRQVGEGEAAHAGPGDWILFGASGPAAIVLDATGAPPRCWIVLEAAAHPGAFVGAVDTPSVNAVVGRDGLLLPPARARGRHGLVFRLDRTPVQVEVLGASSTGTGRPVTAGQVLAARSGGPEIRVLGCQGALGGPVKAGIGEGTLLKILRQRGRRGSLITLLLVVLAAGGLATAGYYVLRDRDRQREAEQTAVARGLRDTQERTAAALAAEQAERDRKLATLSFQQLDISRKFGLRQKELDRDLKARQAQLVKEFEARQARMKEALKRATQNEREQFQALMERYKDSVFLLHVEWFFKGPSGSVRAAGWGTGWIASPDGLLVTNRHVVEGWKHIPELIALLKKHPGLQLEKTGMYAWSDGMQFVDAKGEVPNRRTSYNSLPGGALRLRGVAGDLDLAVLQIRRNRPFVALPIKHDPDSLKEMHPVMLLGFPMGGGILRAGTTHLSHSLGTIRYVDAGTVEHSATSFGGNSGGPLLSLDGEVVGVHASGHVVNGETLQNLKTAIRSDHLLTILRRFR